MCLSPKMKKLCTAFNIDHEDLSKAILELNFRMDKFEEKVNKTIQMDACNYERGCRYKMFTKCSFGDFCPNKVTTDR